MLFKTGQFDYYNHKLSLMTTSTPLSGVQKMALGRIKSLQRSIGIGLFLLFGWSGSLWAGIINVPGNQPTIAAAISVAVAGDVIMVAPGTYVITSQINLNKDVTIDGGDKTTTKIQGNFSVGTYFVLISGAGANATIQNITFEKTDKTGEQNLIGLQANGVTFDNCVFQGQYILDDPDVSRAFEVAGSTTGFLINDCTIKNLRQPGYLNPNCAGQITNCYVDQTRGWVLDGGTGSNVQFNGNTWGNNAFDIAILNGTSLGAPYDPLEDLVANNGGASISDQRSYKAYNITKDLSYNAATAIQDAINAADPADEIQIRMGTHNETITVSEEVTLIGSGNGSDPSSNTVIKAATACTGTAFTISANNVTLKNMHIKDYATGVQLSAVNNAALEDLAIEDHCTYGINFAGSLAEEIDIKNTSINRTGAPGTSVGIRAGTASGVDGLLVDGCIITNNYQGISVFQATTPVAFTDITIQNSTISNNAIKGMYFEKLDNALLKGLTMDNNGTDVTYGFNNGIDINLKYDDYSNITIENCDITNSGVTGTAADPENPAAVAIKARDDAPSYNLNPATLTDVVIKNSRISGPQNGIRFGEFGKINATPSNITLTNNNLGHGFAHKELISRINNDITLNCNWHGSTDVPTITGRFVTAGSGGIDLNQFLDTNTDGNPAVGFQPSGVCICPSGLLVTNDNTNVTYCTIQEAVDAATAGDKLIASPGTFTENVTINKALILEGSNAGISCGDPMRGAESVISPASGVPFTVTASGVTINGFEITGAASANAIVCGNTSDLNIQYNNIHDIGTTVNGSHVHAINYTVANSPAATEDVLIADNCFDNIGNFSNHQRSTSAIGILQSTSTGTLTGLTIERNTITNVKAKNVAWTLGGRIANGITINVGGNANFLLNGKVVNAMIRNNEITNLEGFIATGIGLEGNTENGVVENNLVLNLTGYKNDTRANGGFDLSGLKFENNRYVNTCTVENNSFQTNTFVNNGTPNLGYAISNYVTDANGGEATLSCNWMGTAVYADILDNVGMTGKVFAKAGCTINFVPFLVNGTDNSSSSIGFQPVAGACTGGPVKVYNGGTFVSAHDAIQEAIEAATTLNGYSIRVASGTYDENVDAATPNKNVSILPGNSPGCVTINGDYTLNSGDVLEMEIEGLTACTQHDKLIVNGVVTLNNATLSLPISMFLVEDGDQITIIENDGADPVVGMFQQGNFAFDGQNQYYIDYKGGDGNDVVLSKCCGAMVDLGVFTTTVGTPAGQKLLIKAKPNKDAVYGAYSAGTFTLRTLSANAVPNFAPANVSSDFGYLQIGTKQSSGGYDYFIFNFEALPDTSDLKNWTAGSEHNLATLTYPCTNGVATFELVNDAFAISIGGEFYQELSGETNPGAQGIFYTASATGPTVVSITATSNSPVCQTMEIDLNSTTSNGSPSYTYVWDGPDSYSNTVADPAPFTADLVDAGVYNVTVTDGNGCTATASTTVVVPATGACVKNESTVKYYPTINQAIDAALTLNGHTLTVPAGTWAEDVVVDKELTINGPKVGVSGCDPGRGTGEAIVVPATNAVRTGEIFHVNASNVTIDGFTIDGDNTLLASGVTNPTGADMNAAEGVTLYEDNKSNLKVRNNIFQNLSYFGVTFFGTSFSAPATSGHEVADNKFQHLGTYNDAGAGNINFWGGGVLLYNNQYTNVKDNCMEDVRIGIQTGNYAQANPGGAVYQEIDNNTIAARRRGIFHNLHYSAASGDRKSVV